MTKFTSLAMGSSLSIGSSLTLFKSKSTSDGVASLVTCVFGSVGMTTAGVTTAGVTTAGVTTAGVTTTGVATVGVTTAGGLTNVEGVTTAGGLKIVGLMTAGGLTIAEGDLEAGQAAGVWNPPLGNKGEQKKKRVRFKNVSKIPWPFLFRGVPNYQRNLFPSEYRSF